MKHYKQVFVITFMLVLALTACRPSTPTSTPTPSPLAGVEFAYFYSPDPATVPPTLYHYVGNTSASLIQYVWEYAWSPDGSKIVATVLSGQSYSERTICLFDMETHQLTPFVQGEFPTWSPDGTQIAYQSRNTDNDPLYPGAVFVTGLEQGNPTRKLVSLQRFASFPSWSPDGKWIAYQDASGNGYSLFILDVDTLAVTKLADGVDDTNATLAWSPDSTKILFEGLGGSNSDIFVADVNTGSVTDLTQDNPARLDADVDWSPDGNSILFVSFRDDDIPHVYVMNADGSNVIRLSDLAGFEPVWSPDGSQVLYAQKDGSIILMNADGSGLIPVPNVEAKGYRPQWRPQ